MTKHDVTAIKLFLSKTHDRARPAFGRARVDRARRCVFAGTTNDDKYLRDTTGNRRVWPAKAHGLIDLEGVRRDRDQLWAEAAVAEASGELLTLPQELWGAAGEVQQARLTHDPWEDEIERKLARLREDKVKDGSYWVDIDNSGGREWRVASSYLLGEFVLGLAVDRQTNAVTKRLAEVMRTLGWSNPPTAIRVGSLVCRGYTKPIDEPKTKDEPKAIAEPKPIVEAARPKLVLIRRPIRI
jgi:putative DNA primase/helicase